MVFGTIILNDQSLLENPRILDYEGNTVISQEACPENFWELGYITICPRIQEMRIATTDGELITN